MRTADLLRRRDGGARRAVRHHRPAVQRAAHPQGGGPDGLPTLEVGARMVEETPGITRLLDRLESKGLVRRQRCPKDRRQHLCWITRGGARSAGARSTEPVVTHSDEVMRGLSREEQSDLIRLLDRVRAALG
ncbi:MAG: MarR family transcriptional regulator [Candidatus Moduliflexus flocculans]|nr:MarR family transcriptional regulator [Candidatus Moduliflexus flocculans]